VDFFNERPVAGGLSAESCLEKRRVPWAAHLMRLKKSQDGDRARHLSYVTAKAGRLKLTIWLQVRRNLNQEGHALTPPFLLSVQNQPSARAAGVAVVMLLLYSSQSAHKPSPAQRRSGAGLFVFYLLSFS
jgi:hypothetical protein